MNGGFIWGFQALAGLLLIWMAAREHNRDGRQADAETENATARAGLVAVLSDAWKKAKGRGVAGYDRSLGFCALSECIARLRRGDDIDLSVAADALDLLGMTLEEKEGAVSVIEK